MSSYRAASTTILGHNVEMSNIELGSPWRCSCSNTAVDRVAEPPVLSRSPISQSMADERLSAQGRADGLSLRAWARPSPPMCAASAYSSPAAGDFLDPQLDPRPRSKTKTSGDWAKWAGIHSLLGVSPWHPFWGPGS